MLSCEHKCCLDCARKHFTIIIKDKGIHEAVCPFCREPRLTSAEDSEAEDEDKAAAYFARLDLQLKAIVDQANRPPPIWQLGLTLVFSLRTFD